MWNLACLRVRVGREQVRDEEQGQKTALGHGVSPADVMACEFLYQW